MSTRAPGRRPDDRSRGEGIQPACQPHVCRSPSGISRWPIARGTSSGPRWRAATPQKVLTPLEHIREVAEALARVLEPGGARLATRRRVSAGKPTSCCRRGTTRPQPRGSCPETYSQVLPQRPLTTGQPSRTSPTPRMPQRSWPVHCHRRVMSSSSSSGSTTVLRALRRSIGSPAVADRTSTCSCMVPPSPSKPRNLPSA